MGDKKSRVVRASLLAATLIGGTALGASPAVAAGPDLVISPFTQSEVTGLNEGDIVELPVVWGNTTGHTVQHTVLNMRLNGAVSFSKDFHNCGYAERDLEHSRLPEMLTATCVIDQPIAPGEVLRLNLPVQLKARATGAADTLAVSVSDQLPAGDLGERGTGADVTAATVPGVKPGDFAAQSDTANLGFKLNPTSDLQALGASATAKQGEETFFSVGVRQNGSANAGSPNVDVVLPPGVKTLRGAGAECEPAAKVGEQEHYSCRSDEYGLPGHGSQSFAFYVRVEKFIPDAKGSVKLTDLGAGDSNPANDVADIVFNGPAPAPTPTPTPTTKPVTITLKDPFPPKATASPTTPAPTASASTAAAVPVVDTSTTAATAEPADSAELAATGSGTEPLALASAAAVLAGAAMVFTARRRKGRHTV